MIVLGAKMGIILSAYLPALIGMFIIALFVLSQQRRPTYITFAAILFTAVLWQVFQLISLFVSDPTALWLMRFSLITSNFLGPTFVLFALLYPEAKEWLSVRTVLVIFGPIIVLTPLTLAPDMVSSISRHGYDLILNTGYLYSIQTILGVGYNLVALGILIYKYAQKTSRDRTAILLLILAFSLPLVVGVLTNYLWINSAGAQYLLPVTFLATATIIAYAMIKHRLFDIRVAAVRGAVYLLSLATLAGLYYVMAFVVSEIVLNQSNAFAVSASPISIGLALVLAFVFQPVKRFFDKLTNSIFFHDSYNLNDFLQRLGHELSTSSDLRSLLQRASKEISTTFQAEQGFFFVRSSIEHHINAGTSGHSTMTIEEIMILDTYVRASKPGAIVVNMLSDADLPYGLLSRHKIAIVLPLLRDGEVQSYLFIGRRLSREYMRRDVRILETIANELVIAIQNALSVQEVKDINETLQQRIEDATQELRASNLQLQRLDEAKDEFVSMASHQLRTPLTSVKGYISMVLEGDAGRITAMQRQLLGEAFTSSERMVHLISDFLNVSRLQTGKFMIDQHPVNLSKVIAQEVDSLQTTATAHNLKLRFRAPSYFPTLYIDEGKIRQVVMNFIDNAIYYSHEDTTINVELAVIDGSAVLQVHDTGIGVPKSEQAHLFTKFFRATNARKQRPDGTGVGLFLAKKVIVAHSGSILFESTEGEGSIFGFRLPIKKLGLPPVDSANELNK